MRKNTKKNGRGIPVCIKHPSAGPDRYEAKLEGDQAPIHHYVPVEGEESLDNLVANVHKPYVVEHHNIGAKIEYL